MRRVGILLGLICLSTATVALAATGGTPGPAGSTFVPITPIPSPSGGGIATEGGISTYINAMFEYAIIAGAGLAAIYIAIGGFEYIFSEALQGKQDGRERITSALFGLMILLLMTIILYVINPDLVSLRFLQ